MQIFKSDDDDKRYGEYTLKDKPFLFILLQSKWKINETCNQEYKECTEKIKLDDETNGCQSTRNRYIKNVQKKLNWMMKRMGVNLQEIDM